jgi:transposase
MRVVSEYFAGGEAGKPDEVMEPCTQLFLPDLMNAQVSAQHLEILLETYPDVLIILFWDRAPGHRGKPIDQVLEQHPRLEIIFFPTASPDLNPQEQVWKSVRKEVSHNHLEIRLPELAERFLSKLNSSTFKSSFLDKYGYSTIRPMFI